MLRLILIALLLFVVTRLVLSFARSRRTPNNPVQGRAARKDSSIPPDRIEDASFKDIPDKS